MNQRLADAIDLQSQLKQAHWNVKGPNFIGLHKLFDDIYEAVGDYVDLVAERIVQLGGVAEGTVRVAAVRSRLESYPLTAGDGPAHVEAVSKALATFGREVRLSIDEATELDDATRPIYSPRFPAGLTNGFGLSRRMPKRRLRTLSVTTYENEPIQRGCLNGEDHRHRDGDSSDGQEARGRTSRHQRALQP